jgi:preprotein translocase subunit SecG
MLGLIIFIHVTVCILLIILILIQRGHGGGLVESFSGLDSMFGTKTNTFLSKATTVLSSMFLVTCLTLAVFSARQSKSLLERALPAAETAPQTKPELPIETTPKPETQPPVSAPVEAPAQP